MTESATPEPATPEPATPEPATPGQGSTPKPELAGAGLSATGTTADQFVPGQAGTGATYGDPGGTGTADAESAVGDLSEEAGQDAGGDAEGGERPAP